VLIDFDSKGLPPNVAAKLDDFWSALVSVCPGLSRAAHVIRRSTQRRPSTR
jgi:hypothetical protein